MTERKNPADRKRKMTDRKKKPIWPRPFCISALAGHEPEALQFYTETIQFLGLRVRLEPNGEGCVDVPVRQSLSCRQHTGETN